MLPEHVTADKVGLLLNQIRWVTRISVALSSALNIEDVYSVLVSGLVSPLGLGYSNAVVFEVDNAADMAKGKFAIGLASKAESDELLADLKAETGFLEERRAELVARAERDQSAAEELRTLELGSQWVTVFQRLGTDNEMSRQVEKMRFSFDDPDIIEGGFNIFDRAVGARGPIVLRKTDTGTWIPPELDDLLPNEFALVPIKTNRGLRSVIFLDRRVSGGRITDDDVEGLDWFATQGALALQNAELISDLGNAYQELKAVDQLKTNFLSIISHELRTPLTAITGFVELILNNKVGEINEGQRNLLTRVSKNTGHLNNMVNDLIEIAEIESEGMHDVTLEPVDPLDTLYATLPKLEFRRRDSRIQVEPVFNGVIPRILCDQRALERIFFHLLDNAVKFSPKNEAVRVEFDEIGENVLRIGIRDQGVGIPKDKLARIWDQFYQIDNSLTRSQEGLGLGLAVTRILVQSTKGEIDVESVEGKGSCFMLKYPIARPPKSMLAPNSRI